MTLKIKNRHALKKKDIRKIRDYLENQFSQHFFDDSVYMEVGYMDDTTIIFVDDKPILMKYNDRIIFTLYGLDIYRPERKKVVVDMGAVKFVTNGADVMAPGIVDSDEDISEDDLIWICDERHYKPLAVGIALMNGKHMKKEKQGKAVKVFHHVGDKLWNFTYKSL